MDDSEQHPRGSNPSAAAPAPADLAAIADRLEAVRRLLARIKNEVGPHTVRGAEAIIERERATVYSALESLGLAVHEFVQTDPPPERLAAVRALLSDHLQRVSLTSPITLYAAQGKRKALSYYELIRHIQARRAAGADVVARVLDDFYAHTRTGEAFLNRLNLIVRRLADEVAGRLAAGEQPLHVVSLHYIGGDDLLSLAEAVTVAAGLQLTCLDDNREAVRDAEQKLKPVFGGRIRCLKAAAAKWLHGPDCQPGTAGIIYAPSLIEQLPTNQALRVLAGAHRALRPGGALLLGVTAGEPPVAERMIRDWVLGSDWQYRSEDEWHALFAQSPFGADGLAFEYEALGINAVMCARKTAQP